ncbi:MAG: hypothetical protein JJ896_08360 [Rhodothermales bacterium]|nr:hypothetical protein [Rhodothermales bacterium]MBO6779655.1 hypothetical protein [Rhodothermales bacterium]
MLFTGCERPFVEVSVPEIEIVEPNPDLVLQTVNQNLVVRAESFRAVDRVELGGRPFERQSDGSWRLPVILQNGANRLVIETFDSEETASTDTLELLVLPTRVETAASAWSDPRGGHTVTPLLNGDLLLAGGAGSTTGDVSADIFELPFGSTLVRHSGVRFHHARIGHTASVLPDGRILFLGGASNTVLDDVSDLVETAELYDPQDGSIIRLGTTGPPIRRAYHTALVAASQDGIVVSVIGGTGDIRYNPAPELGVRRDIRSFLLIDDHLQALSPAIGPFIEALSGHSSTPLARQPPGTATRELISGALFLGNGVETHHFVLDPRSPLGLAFEDIEPPNTLRTEHEAVQITPGRVLRLGGIVDAESTLSGTLDLFDDATSRFLDFEFATIRNRHLHGATIVDASRILVIGGFGEDGTALSTLEYVVFDL